MAESTASLGYDDLRKEIGAYLGFGRTTASWSTGQADTIASCLQSGLRQFYTPPVLQGEMYAHEWSFLRPQATMTIWASVQENTSVTATGVAGASTTTITASVSTFVPSMVGAEIEFNGLTGAYPIVSYTSPTVVVVDGLVPTPATARTFSIDASGDYRLPDDFAQLDGPISFSTQQIGGVIQQTGESIIRERRQEFTGTGQPTIAAVIPRTLGVVGATAGQRFDLAVFPTPDFNYTVRYRYRVHPNAIAASGYPYGGLAHAETILASCLSVAERRVNDRAGEQHVNFLERLRASVSMDRMGEADTLGYNGDGRGFGYAPDTLITYKGVSY
jgi:hypothetical protein